MEQVAGGCERSWGQTVSEWLAGSWPSRSLARSLARPLTGPVFVQVEFERDEGGAVRAALLLLADDDDEADDDSMRQGEEPAASQRPFLLLDR